MRGEDLEDDLPSWEATDQLVRLTKKPKTTKRLLDLIFKKSTDWFDMTSFPSRDCGPWDQAIRFQDLLVVLQQRYVAGRDLIELAH